MRGDCRSGLTISSIPSATVKTRMFYARKKLAELVQAA